MTPEAFLHFSAANPNVRMECNTRGELELAPFASFSESGITGEVHFQVAGWARHDGTGKSRGPDAGFVLANGATRAPDASWTRGERIAALPGETHGRFLPLCPDFVVEVRSESDRLVDQQDKMAEYIESGARLAWLIDPLTRRVHVYRPGQAPMVLADPAAVSAEPELPGFVLDLTTVW